MAELAASIDAFSTLPEGTAVVCHDAGAANVIIAGLQRDSRRTWRACMQGPAARAWEQAFGYPAPCQTITDAICNANFLLSGTGWGSDLEHDARVLARESGIPSAALLDHWVNYPQRFERQGRNVMPDEIWVTDKDALRLATELFPGHTLRRAENWYMSQQLADVGTPAADAQPELLYLAEPARSDWGREMPGEFQALDYFAGELPNLGLPNNLRIRIRPHPSDPPGKYDPWIKSRPDLPLELDQSPSLAIALSRANWVAGCESYGLVVALAAGRRVYCALPPWAPRCRLPQSGLIHLAALGQ